MAATDINGKNLNVNGSTNPPMHGQAGMEGVGTHYQGVPYNSDYARMVDEDFIKDPLDREIVRMHTSATPIDQICRFLPQKKTAGMRYSSYSIDDKVITDTIKTSVAAGNVNGAPVDIKVNDAMIFAPNDTLFLPKTNAYSNAEAGNGAPARLLVLAVKDSETLTVIALNGDAVSGTTEKFRVPATTAGDTVVRMGPAYSEGDMQGNIYGATPSKRELFMQIFKTQVAETTIMKETETEVDWTLTDQMEMALTQLRKDIELTYIFGVQSYILKPIGSTGNNKHVYTCSGILEQLAKFGGKFIEYDADAMAERKEEYLISEFIYPVWIGNSGSTKRYGLFGSGLVKDIACIDNVERQMDAKSIEKKFGFEWSQIVFQNWLLDVKTHPLFDELNMSHCGLILDLAYIEKRVFRALKEDVLDLKKAGVFDGDSMVWTEISSICVKYHQCHAFIYDPEEFDPLFEGDESSSSSAA